MVAVILQLNRLVQGKSSPRFQVSSCVARDTLLSLFEKLHATEVQRKNYFSIQSCQWRLTVQRAERVWREPQLLLSAFYEHFCQETYTRTFVNDGLSDFWVWTKACCSWDRIVWEGWLRPQTSRLKCGWLNTDTPRNDTPITHAHSTLTEHHMPCGTW